MFGVWSLSFELLFWKLFFLEVFVFFEIFSEFLLVFLIGLNGKDRDFLVIWCGCLCLWKLFFGEDIIIFVLCCVFKFNDVGFMVVVMVFVGIFVCEVGIDW